MPKAPPKLKKQKQIPIPTHKLGQNTPTFRAPEVTERLYRNAKIMAALLPYLIGLCAFFAMLMYITSGEKSPITAKLIRNIGFIATGLLASWSLHSRALLKTKPYLKFKQEKDLNDLRERKRTTSLLSQRKW